MNTNELKRLLGRLEATTDALEIESAHLSEQDEDTAVRLVKLVAMLRKVTDEMAKPESS